MLIDGTNIAITGAGSGIGRALAKQLAARGCSVALADIEAGALAETVEMIEAIGTPALGVETDVSDAAAMRIFADAAIDRFGHVDVVVNNAGVSTFNLLEDQTLADWKWVVEVNLLGVVNGLDAFLPGLIARERAHVVNVASVAGVQSGIAYLGPYAATKVAVVSISETLSQEMQALHPHVGVTVLCPSNTDTGVMRAERNRPAEFGVEQRTTTAEAWRSGIEASFTGPTGRTADDVAAQLVDGVEADRLFVFTHPEAEAMLMDRLDRVSDAVRAEGRRHARLATSD